MTPAVKICGITRVDDATFAAQQGADYLGFNFWPESKRCVDRDRVQAMAYCARRANSTVRLVGLFVNASVTEMVATAARFGLDVIQLHGDEPPTVVEAVKLAGYEVWKAIAISAHADITSLDAWPADGFVLDAPSAGRGGSGQKFDWSIATAAVGAGRRVILAGGLTPGNVATAIHAVHPFAVDVASGVESSPGEKDPVRVVQFMTAVRRDRSYVRS
jgi:phosphoribosylanthranilate isomerase